MVTGLRAASNRMVLGGVVAGVRDENVSVGGREVRPAIAEFLHERKRARLKSLAGEVGAVLEKRRPAR